MRVIDAHQHIWDPAGGEYPWLEAGDPLARRFDQREIEPEHDRAGITGCVLVQSANTTEDTELMLATALTHPRVVGIVGWVPLEQPETVGDALDSLRTAGPVVGIRDLIHTRADPRWALRDDVAAGIDAVADAGLAFDVVTAREHGLALVPELAARHPRLRIVIDHLGKPPIGGTATDRRRWRERIAACAALPTVAAKISGLYSAVGGEDEWTVDGIRPFVDDAIEAFGVDRLMLGGDWPICIRAGGFRRVWGAIDTLIAPMREDERAHLAWGTAQRWYGIPDAALRRAAAAPALPEHPHQEH